MRLFILIFLFLVGIFCENVFASVEEQSHSKNRSGTFEKKSRFRQHEGIKLPQTPPINDSNDENNSPNLNQSIDAHFSFDFQGPKKWKKVVDGLPAKVMVAFVGKSSSVLPPSINLAIERTTIDLTAYAKRAKQLHEQHPATTCMAIGSINTKGGKAELLQIVSTTNCGEIQCLQAILVKENIVYVLTATALKDEYSKYYMQFFQSIKNFTPT